MSLTGKYHTQFRDYDPLHCKWLSRDPIAEAGGVNLNGYCGNNGLDTVDPMGLWNLWSPATWGVANGVGYKWYDSVNPFHESAGWSGAWEGAKGGATIYADTMTFSKIQALNNAANQYQGGCFTASRVSSRISRTMWIGAGTGGALSGLANAAAGGSTAAEILHGGAQVALGVMAANSAGQNLGEATVDYETGNYIQGSIKTTLGVVDVVSAVTGTKTGFRDLSRAAPKAARAFNRALSTSADPRSGSILIGPGTKVGPQVTANQIQGQLGEDVVRQRLLNNPNVELIGEQFRIRTPGVGKYRVVDFVVRGKKTGKLRIIEVKTGGAKRTTLQRTKDALIANQSAITTWFGKRASSRFRPGTPTGPIRTFEVNASHLRNP